MGGSGGGGGNGSRQNQPASRRGGGGGGNGGRRGPRAAPPAPPPAVVTGIGKRLLEKMGWKDGQGLGKQGEGRTEPVAASSKTAGDTGGLGFKGGGRAGRGGGGGGGGGGSAKKRGNYGRGGFRGGGGNGGGGQEQGGMPFARALQVAPAPPSNPKPRISARKSPAPTVDGPPKMKLLSKMDAADVEKLFVAALQYLVNGVGREQLPFNGFKIIDRMRKMSTS